MYTFETPQPVTVSVRIRSGAVVVTAEERDTAAVEVLPSDRAGGSDDTAERYVVELNGDTLVVEPPDALAWSLWRRGGSVRIHVRVPLDSSLSVKSASADTQVLGRWREGSVDTASGEVRVEEFTGNLSIKSASGDVSIDRVGGDLNAASASGEIWVGSVGADASMHSASGAVQADDVGGSANVKTASGDVTLGRLRAGQTRVQTVSGDTRLYVLPGTGVYFDVNTVSGDTSSDLAADDVPADGGASTALTIYARSVSGDVRISRASEKASA
jgi:hypothetical protein